MYRGEIQNDSNGGNYNRSLAYSPSISGLGDGGRGETRNFAVGAPLRGGDEPPRVEVPNMTDFIRLFSLGNKDAADKLEKTIYGNGKPFTKEQLT